MRASWFTDGATRDLRGAPEVIMDILGETLAFPDSRPWFGHIAGCVSTLKEIAVSQKSTRRLQRPLCHWVIVEIR